MKGKAFERIIINKLASAFGLKPFNNKNKEDWNIASTRAASRTLDGQGVDIVCKVPPLCDYTIQITKRIVRTKEPTIPVAKLERICHFPNPVLIIGLYRKKKIERLIGIMVVTYSEKPGTPVKGWLPATVGIYTKEGVHYRVDTLEKMIDEWKTK
ncbi:MAG: hypothetical protein D6746_07170 [Bacteroidetes bacterium]|nr:MAG: hypothetical protein D6746_07170 [Bacteroidota bacterium]